MPLFVNNQVSPKVFSNDTKLDAGNNQANFQLNYLKEILAQQQENADKLRQNLFAFGQSLAESKNQHLNNYSSIAGSLAKQGDSTERLNRRFSEFSDSALRIEHKLLKLEEKQVDLSQSMLAGDLTSQAILDQLAFQQTMITDLNRKLLEYEDVTQALDQQTKKQEEVHALLLEQFDLQGIFHKTTMERLSNLEKVNEKLIVELCDIKSFISQKGKLIFEKFQDLQASLSQFLSFFLIPNFSKPKKIMHKEFETSPERKN
ncbi:hypothetical protein [Bacillus sp. REN3]|uniref:hypothetical protein n=1 Tax=Bacillus sp. REN3 TaxID=2802440 RepID=UPI001AEDB8BC|nr:hypothetical protein [Bacillus sp. REN3]